MPRAAPASRETSSGTETGLNSVDVLISENIQPSENGAALQVGGSDHSEGGSHTESNVGKSESGGEKISAVHSTTNPELGTGGCGNFTADGAVSIPGCDCVSDEYKREVSSSSHLSATWWIETKERQHCIHTNSVNFNDGAVQLSEYLVNTTGINNGSRELNSISGLFSKESATSPEMVSQDSKTSRNRKNCLKRSASECCCVCSARKISSSLSPRLHLVSIPASHLCQGEGKAILKKALSADNCALGKGTPHRRPSGRKGTLSPLLHCSSDQTEICSTRFRLEAPHNNQDHDRLMPKRLLSVIPDMEEPKRENAGLDDHVHTDVDKVDDIRQKEEGTNDVCLGHGIATLKLFPSNADPLRMTNSANVNAAGVTNDVDDTSSTPLTHLGKNLPGIKECTQKSITENNQGLDTKQRYVDTAGGSRMHRQSERPASMDNLATLTLDSGYTMQEKNDNLDFEPKQDSTPVSIQFRHKAEGSGEIGSKYGTSLLKGSADLSPQPEFSFVWSDILSGSANTMLSFSNLNDAFLRSPTSTQLGDLLPPEDTAGRIFETTPCAKGLSVPERPTSPDTNDIEADVRRGVTKRTVSCPLSFDDESICYETGDQEVFTPRQSSSSCWCCDKSERGLGSSGSVHMDVEEYERLRERLGQRPHTPALWEDPKSDRISLERDLDMATLDCSIAGVEDYSHVELFTKRSSSSGSFEQWLQEDMKAFGDKNAEGNEHPRDPANVTAETLHKMFVQLGRITAYHHEAPVQDMQGSVKQQSETTGHEGEKNATSLLMGSSGQAISNVVLNLSNDNHPVATKSEPQTIHTKEEETAAEFSGGGPNEELSASSKPFLNTQGFTAGYVNTPFRGLSLANLLESYATGLSIQDVVQISCKPASRTAARVGPCLDNVDFTKYTANEDVSLEEALARMPKIICKTCDGKSHNAH